jgi:hypothetical protein
MLMVYMFKIFRALIIEPGCSHYLPQNTSGAGNSNEDSVAAQWDECTSVIPCFSTSINETGGLATSGDVALLVPPYTVPALTQFDFSLGWKSPSMPALPSRDKNLFSLSPILSLSPHDAKFLQKVFIRFPFAAVSKGWLLRLVSCPLDGDNWEVLVDVLVPHSMSASSLTIMTRDGASFDPDTNMISVDHFCYKCWVGVPIRHNATKRIWCSLFGRPLGSRGTWEIVVRCFEPYLEVYQRIAEMMEKYGAEPLIDGPEQLEIGKQGVVSIALQNDLLYWQLDSNCQSEYTISAKSTFWEDDAKSLFGLRFKFIVKPAKEIDYVHVVALVSYIDSMKNQSRTIHLEGTAPVSGSLPRRLPNVNVCYPSVYNVTGCHNLNVGPDNTFVRKGVMARSRDQVQPMVDDEIVNEGDPSDVARSANAVKPKGNAAKAIVIHSTDGARVQPFEPQTECGQHVYTD